VVNWLLVRARALNLQSELLPSILLLHNINTFGQVVNTHMPVSTSSVVGYHTHTHTHKPFYGPLGFCPGLPG